MKINFIKRKNNDSKTKDSNVVKSTPGIQDSEISKADPKPGKAIFLRLFGIFKGGKAAERTPGVRESEVSDAGQKPGKAVFPRLFRKFSGGKAAKEKPEIRESEAAEEKPEIQGGIVTEEKPETEESKVSGEKPKFWARFSGIFRKPGKPEAAEETEVREREAAEEKPEIQGGIVTEEKPETEESKVSGEKPKFWARFSGIFRKPGKSEAAEETEVRESEAAEEKPEIQGGIVTEEKPETEESKVSGEKPKFWARLSGIFRKPGKSEAAEETEVRESEAAEEKPEIQGGIVTEEKPETEESKVSEEKPEFWARFSGIFTKFGKAKAAGEKPETQEGLTGVEREPSEEAKTVLFTKKKPWTLVKKIVVSVSSVLILAALIAGLLLASLSFNPLGGLKTIAEQTHTPAPSVLPQSSGGEDIIEPSPTVDPYDVLKAQADFSMLDDIVNILLIGVDHGDERDSDNWRGKTAWHSDVMIVLSINTNTNKVSLISLPRDTFAKIPGVSGIYKLNASLNCGGGWPEDPGDDEQAPFLKVCEAASWMIGNIPIQYYYAVDFSAVKELVNAIGGVDFNVDIAFEINGRSYKTGWQHMDGQGALDYMRVRKKENIEDPNGETGDLNRINRQKAMLVAIFETLKKTGNISNLPDILSAFDGNLYTNVPIDKTAGLAYYAYKNIDPQTISVCSMDGKYAYYLFDWHFVITNMSTRVRIIKEVYGIDITKDKDVYSQYSRWTKDKAWSLWYNMQTEVALDKSRPLLDEAKEILDEDALLPPPPSASALYLNALDPDPTDPPPTDPPPTDPPPTDPPPTDPPPTDPPPSPTPTEYRKYGDEVRQLYETCENEYTALEKRSESDSSKTRGELIEKYKKDVQALCKVLSIKAKRWDENKKKWIGEDWDDFWKVIYNAKNKRDCNQHYIKNEVYVDFR